MENYNKDATGTCNGEAKASILEKMDKQLQYEIDIYAEGISKINSKIDRFKCKPEEKCSDKELGPKPNSEYFYTLGEKLTTLSKLNKELELVYNRLSEIL
jgi:hypothetical protein